MLTPLVKTHSDGIWISESREKAMLATLHSSAQGFNIVKRTQENFGYPTVYENGSRRLHYRLVDSVFLPNPDAWTDSTAIIVTDNHVTRPVAGRIISALPEFWSIWRFEPSYIDRIPIKRFNCFMNRPRGDRSMVYYELIRRGLLDSGLVSYNCTQDELDQQYLAADLLRYSAEHAAAQVPYNTVEANGTLEQCIIDSCVSLVLETYTADDHIVLSEKIFRVLQLPRPWLVYTSPGAVSLLRSHGFDVLDDYVDTAYDTIQTHHQRLNAILNQLQQIDTIWTAEDYARFDLAAQHNRNLLSTWANVWPQRLETIVQELKNI